MNGALENVRSPDSTTLGEDGDIIPPHIANLPYFNVIDVVRPGGDAMLFASGAKCSTN